MSRLRQIGLRQLLFVAMLALFGILICGWSTLLLLALVALELYIVYRGQREIFGWAAHLVPRPLLYALVAPGTVMHELSHVVAARLLWVRVDEVHWFSPKTRSDGVTLLGYVRIGETTTARQTLVASSPLWLVPVLLIAWSCLVLGSQVLSDPAAAIGSADVWKLPIWAYVVLSCGTAAFPSTEDEIPIEGGFVLALLAVLVIRLGGLLPIVALVLLLPAISAGLLWVGVRLALHQKGLKPIDSEVAGLPGRTVGVCAHCLHSQSTDSGGCSNCGQRLFYTATRGYVVGIPSEISTACQHCGSQDRDLLFRGFRSLFGDFKPPLVRQLSGYYCRRCVRRRFWTAELQTLFASGWRLRMLLRKGLTLLMNIPARFAAPFNLGGAGALSLDQLRAMMSEADDDARDTVRLAPDWWISLKRDEQEMVLSKEDYYGAMKISTDASERQIKTAFRTRSKQLHPDAGGSKEAMQQLNRANLVLSDRALRYAYDHRAELPHEAIADPAI